MELRAINRLLRIVGLVLVLEMEDGGMQPTKIYVMTYRNFKARCCINKGL